MADSAKSYYELLGLSMDKVYTPDEIKHTYRIKSKHYHPDKHPKNESSKWGAVFNQLTNAKDWLIENNQRNFRPKYWGDNTGTYKTAKHSHTTHPKPPEHTTHPKPQKHTTYPKPPEHTRCCGLTNLGGRCRNYVIDGKYCYHHEPTGVNRCCGFTTSGDKCKMPINSGKYCHHHSHLYKK